MKLPTKASLRNLCVGLAGLGLMACSNSTPAFTSPDTSNAPRKHVMVQVMNSYVHPATAQLVSGGTISWVSYTTNYSIAVLFPASIKSALTCTELRPNWNEIAAGIQSLPISATSGISDMELPCPLKPGTYDYQVQLFDAMDGGGMFDPQLTLPAKIVVQ